MADLGKILYNFKKLEKIKFLSDISKIFNFFSKSLQSITDFRTSFSESGIHSNICFLWLQKAATYNSEEQLIYGIARKKDYTIVLEIVLRILLISYPNLINVLWLWIYIKISGVIYNPLDDVLPPTNWALMAHILKIKSLV